jgi:hypothetical protein
MKSGPKPAQTIITNELCSYNCGNKAQYISRSGKLMCSKSSASCPEIKRKNSTAVANKHCEAKIKNGKAGFYDYSSLSDETKNRMKPVKKGSTKESSETLAKAHATRAENLEKGLWIPGVQGVAVDSTLRWRRNLIPYIDSENNECVLESYHELVVANELDKHDIHWIRPQPLYLSDGRRYEPDFYLKEYDMYLDPKSAWYAKALEKYQGFHKQQEQLDKIKQCEEELGISCLILWASEKDSHTWIGIKKQILSYKGLTNTN